MLESVGIPFSILYLGTWLSKHGYDVKLIDGLAEPSTKSFEDRVKRESEGAMYVGFSVMTVHVADALRLSKKIKSWHPGTPTVWGGIHPTLFPKVVCENEFVDFIVYGEGEESILNFTREFEKESPDYSNVPSLGYKKDGEVFLNPFGRTISFEKLPVPDYSLLHPFEQYVCEKDVNALKYNTDRARSTSIHVGRGCPYDCTFCINTVYDKPQLRVHRAMPAQRIYDEMKWFYEEHGVTHFGLQDELFFINKQRADELIEILEKNPLPVKWASNPRVNYFNKSYLSRESLKRLADVGYSAFGLAVESGSDRVIKMFKKNIYREQAIQSVKMLRQEPRFTMQVSFILGIPEEEIEDMYETLTLGIELYKAANGNIFFIGPHIFRPYPGAELYNKCVKEGFKPPETLEDWTKIGLNPAFGFLDFKFLPWLNAEKRRTMNFIIKYFTLVLGTKFDRTLFKLPARVIPLVILLHSLLWIRIKTNRLNNFWVIERTLLNVVTPLENMLRRTKLTVRRVRSRMRPRYNVGTPEYKKASGA